MGIFTCCITPKALTLEEIRKVSHGTDARLPPDLEQKTTQTDKELLAEWLKQEAHEMIRSGRLSSESPKSSKSTIRYGQHDEYMLSAAPSSGAERSRSLEPPEAPLSARTPRALSAQLSARDISKMQSEARRKSGDANPQGRDREDAEDPAEDLGKAMKRVFLEYARFGCHDRKAKTLDVFRFMKLIRECNLMKSPDHAAAVDLIFCKGRTLCAVRKSSSTDFSASGNSSPVWSHYLMSTKTEQVKSYRMDYSGFLEALTQIAALLGVPEADVHSAIASSRGPLVNAVTLPRFVRLHDAVPTDPKSAPPSPNVKRSPGGEQVVERAPGTYSKGMIKSGAAMYGTSGFAPNESARPGSPCFPSKAQATKIPRARSPQGKLAPKLHTTG